MSYCGKCGAQMDEQATVCPQCGAASEQPKQQEGVKEQTQNLVAKLKDPKNRKPLGIALLVIIAIVVIAAVVKSGKKTINLEEMVHVEYSGYDGYGTASASIDYDQYTSKLKEALGNKYPDMDELDWDGEDNGLSYAFQLEEVYDSIEIELDKAEGLSNGDEVTATISYDQEAAKKVGIKLKGDSVKITVEGLEEVEAYNPFDDLQVTFNGVSPNASVEWDYTGDKNIGYYDFEASKKEGIAEGDVITISLSMGEEEALSEGYYLAETSKDYTASDLSKYVVAVADITEENITPLLNDVNDVIESYFAGISDYVSAGESTYEGAYVLNTKDTDSWNYKNYVYIVMKAEVKSKEGAFKKRNVYFPVQFTGVVIGSDGSLEADYVSNQITGSTDLEYNTDSWWPSTIDGYTKVSKMYNDLISANKAEYNVDYSENLK